MVKLKDDAGQWDDGWVVSLVGGEMTEQQLLENEHAHRRFKKETSKD